MRLSRLAFSLLIAFAVFASDSPDARDITDPKSLTSQTERGAAPIPIDDLFFTRTGMAIIVVREEGENSIVVVPRANHDLTPADVRAAKPPKIESNGVGDRGHG